MLDYCAEIVAAARGMTQRQRLNFWGTLALMRCAASSPMAAVLALRTRAGEVLDAEDRGEILERLFDGDADTLIDDDVEPPAATDDPALAALIAQAEALAGQAGDPKLKVLSRPRRRAAGARTSTPWSSAATSPPPTTSAATSTKRLPDATIDGRHRRAAAGGARGPRVARSATHEGPRVLVATDCLSEGVNLQEHFDAVVHYDLSWNPTRHEQREGRVDRFGQPRPVVRATLIYGANNPVDGAVLEVILRKAERIREELGVPVPVPDEGHTLTQALLKAVLLRRRGAPEAATGEGRQLELFEAEWQSAADKAKANRTIFAQRRLKPEDVLPEWHKSLAAIGGREDVQRFTDRALTRLGSGLSPCGDARLQGPHRVAARGRCGSDWRPRASPGTLRIDFRYPPAPRCRSVQRSHPLVAVLAETLLERSLNGAAQIDRGYEVTDPAVLGRVGCWVSDGVRARTTVALLRLRHQLVSRRGRRETTLLVEEATGLAWVGQAGDRLAGAPRPWPCSPMPPADDVPPPRSRARGGPGPGLLAEREAELEAFAAQRADALLDDHLRVRAAAYRDEKAETRGRSARVEALPRPDVIGVFVLLPRVRLTMAMRPHRGTPRATPRGSRTAELAFDALSIEGGLLAADWLARVAQLAAPHQEPDDYGVLKGLELRDEIGRYWRIAQAHWADFAAGQKAGAEPEALTRRFIQGLLRDAFGFTDLAEPLSRSAGALLFPGPDDGGREHVVLGGLAWPLTAIDPAGRVPLVCAPAGSGLDTPRPSLRRWPPQAQRLRPDRRSS